MKRRCEMNLKFLSIEDIPKIKILWKKIEKLWVFHLIKH